MATTNKLKNSVDLERGVSSFNDAYFDQLYNKDQTTHIVVGTLTPPDGREYGFYYCSKSNKMLSYISEELENKKEELRNGKGSVDDIITELKNRGIALIDVYKKADVKKGSALDSDIYNPVLDIKNFEKIDFNKKDLKIAANSANALLELKKILIQIGQEDFYYNNNKVFLIPQRRRGYSKPCSADGVKKYSGKKKVYKNQSELIEEWRKFFNGE